MVVDNVEKVFTNNNQLNLLLDLIHIAKECNKKLFLILNKSFRDKLEPYLTHVHREPIDCPSLTNEQVYQLLGGNSTSTGDNSNLTLSVNNSNF